MSASLPLQRSMDHGARVRDLHSAARRRTDHQLQPVLTSQQRTWCLAILSPSKLAYTVGLSTMKGAPKQVLKVAAGSLPSPFSVPATLAV